MKRRLKTDTCSILNLEKILALAEGFMVGSWLIQCAICT